MFINPNSEEYATRGMMLCKALNPATIVVETLLTSDRESVTKGQAARAYEECKPFYCDLMGFYKELVAIYKSDGKKLSMDGRKSLNIITKFEKTKDPKNKTRWL